MAEITAAAVKSLRDRTGAGMMDCKRALTEAGGDEERAIDLLRQSGVAKAAKRAGREVSEGTVHISVHDGTAVMAEVLSETDFVARSEAFAAFAEKTADTAGEMELPDGKVLDGAELFEQEGGAPIEADLTELRLQVGENVRLNRIVRWTPEAASTVGSYVHFGSRIGVLVELTGGGDEASAAEAARGVAMHIAATNPSGVSPDDIPAEIIEREQAVLIEQAKGEGKPPEIAEKIVEGRMRKFFEENALLWQSYVRDPDKSVKELLAEAGDDVTVRRFVRFEVGA
jgi:elongation factor Ts